MIPARSLSSRLWLRALALCVAVPAYAQSPKVHQLAATPTTVAYGYYWSEAKPALRVSSGDIVELETMLTNTPAGLERIGVKPEDVPQNLRDIVREDTGSLKGPGGHILTGPIYIEGADSGDVLEVRIQSITLPIPYAYNGCSGYIRELCGPSRVSTLIHLDRATMTAEVAPGIVVPLRPFFGSIGVAPAPALGRVSSNPPSRHAGNLDNKELVAGTTLYIPVFVKGALLEVGDGHAAQGDGEVDQTAIETNLRGRLQLVVRKDLKLEWPRAETPTHWITMGTDTSLVVATRTAIREMVKFLQETQRITQTQAYQAASMAADLRITQLVDGNVGVHMMIAKSYLRQPSGLDRLDRMYDYDTEAPFGLREISRARRQDATVVDLSFASPLGGHVPAYLVVPGGKGPFPAVLFSHWMMDGSPLRNRREFLEEAVVLARAGAASLLIDAPQVRAGFPRDSSELRSMELDANASRQQVVDVRRGIDLLIARGDIDPARVAFVGHSFSAHVGGILSAVEKRIGSFVLMAGAFADERYVFNPGNAQMLAFRQRHGDAPLRAYFQQHGWDDPIHFIGRSAPAAVFLQFGSRDDPIPAALARGYFDLFGSPKEIAFYDAGHALDAAARRARVAWLAKRLALGPIDFAALGRIAALK